MTLDELRRLEREATKGPWNDSNPDKTYLVRDRAHGGQM